MSNTDTEPTIAGLATRLTALEQFVHEELKPMIDDNTAMTATIHAQMDEMYAVFIPARNAIRVLSKGGDAAVWVSDVVEKRPKTLLLLAVASLAVWSFFSTGRIPDWVIHILKVAAA